jgi:molecular chaperone GrpE
MKEAEIEIEKMESQSENTNSNPEPLVPVEPATLNAQQLEELKSRASKADDHWNQLLRTAADFENYKKRATREKQEAIKYANESLLEKLLPIMDSLDMALAAAQNTSEAKPQSLQEGIAMVQQQLKKALAEAGLEEVDAQGKVFDPNWHEAIKQQPSADTPEGHVLHQLRKGYKLNGRLLRAASVIVAAPPGNAR